MVKQIEGILEDQGATGVYLLDGEGTAGQIGELAAKHRYAFFILEGTKATDKKRFLAHVAETLKFPEYFGHNWDSLEECLADMSWHDAPGYVILFEQFQELAKSSPGDFETALEIFRDTAESWKNEGKAWYLILQGQPTGTWDLTTVRM